MIAFKQLDFPKILACLLISIGYTSNVNAAPNVYVQSTDNLVIMEAENGVLSGNGVPWVENMQPSGTSGNKAMLASIDEWGKALSSVLTYDFELHTSGDYQVLLRATSGGSGKSLWLSLDNNYLSSSSSQAIYFASADWEWMNGYGVTTLNNLLPGSHTLRLYIREAGTYIDKIALVPVNSTAIVVGSNVIGPSETLIQPLVSDGDGDGISDALDQCPNTLSGTTVDSRGCPIDSNTAYVQSTDNLVVMEAENGIPSGSGNDDPWVEKTQPSGASGNKAMFASKDEWNPANSSVLAYNFDLHTSGDYEVLLRATSGGSGKSLWLSVDNNYLSSSSSQAIYFSSSNWQWMNGYGATTLNNLSAGSHTLRLHTREADTYIDKIALVPVSSTAIVAGSNVIGPDETLDTSPSVSDEDNDGISDALDRCPNTPAGETVDEKGCRITTYQSGVTAKQFGNEVPTYGRNSAPGVMDYTMAVSIPPTTITVRSHTELVNAIQNKNNKVIFVDGNITGSINLTSAVSLGSMRYIVGYGMDSGSSSVGAINISSEAHDWTIADLKMNGKTFIDSARNIMFDHINYGTYNFGMQNLRDTTIENITIQNSRFVKQHYTSSDSLGIEFGGYISYNPSQWYVIRTKNVKILNNVGVNWGDFIQTVGWTGWFQDSGNWVPGKNAGKCHDGLTIAGNDIFNDGSAVGKIENAIDLKGGSCDPGNPVVVAGNRLGGYAKSPTSQGAVIGIHNAASNVLIENNIFFNAALGITVGHYYDDRDGYGLDNGGGHNVHIRNNLMQNMSDGPIYLDGRIQWERPGTTIRTVEIHNNALLDGASYAIGKESTNVNESCNIKSRSGAFDTISFTLGDATINKQVTMNQAIAENAPSAPCSNFRWSK